VSAQELYLAAKNEGLNLTMPQIQAAVAANDVDGDGKLSLQEFLQDPALADLSLLAAASSGQQVSIVTEGGMSMPAPSALKSDPVAASATTMSVQSMSDTTTAGGSSAATTASPATLAQALAQTAIQASTAAYGHALNPVSVAMAMMGAQALSNQGPFTSLMADSQQLSADLDAAAATWQQLVAARQELLQLVSTSKATAAPASTQAPPAAGGSASTPLLDRLRAAAASLTASGTPPPTSSPPTPSPRASTGNPGAGAMLASALGKGARRLSQDNSGNPFAALDADLPAELVKIESAMESAATVAYDSSGSHMPEMARLVSQRMAAGAAGSEAAGVGPVTPRSLRAGGQAMRPFRLGMAGGFAHPMRGIGSLPFASSAASGDRGAGNGRSLQQTTNWTFTGAGFKPVPANQQAPSAAAPSDASRRSELTATIASLMTQLQQHSAHVASDIINVHQDLANASTDVTGQLSGAMVQLFGTAGQLQAQAVNQAQGTTFTMKSDSVAPPVSPVDALVARPVIQLGPATPMAGTATAAAVVDLSTDPSATPAAGQTKGQMTGAYATASVSEAGKHGSHSQVPTGGLNNGGTSATSTPVPLSQQQLQDLLSSILPVPPAQPPRCGNSGATQDGGDGGSASGSDPTESRDGGTARSGGDTARSGGDAATGGSNTAAGGSSTATGGSTTATGGSSAAGSAGTPSGAGGRRALAGMPRGRPVGLTAQQQADIAEASAAMAQGILSAAVGASGQDLNGDGKYDYQDVHITVQAYVSGALPPDLRLAYGADADRLAQRVTADAFLYTQQLANDAPQSQLSISTTRVQKRCQQELVLWVNSAGRGPECNAATEGQRQGSDASGAGAVAQPQPTHTSPA